jgi:4-diphosphocytidyl-2-C-methyl-D-erythritol kinase
VADHVALLMPPSPVPTSGAYAQFDLAPLPAPGPWPVVEALRAGDLAGLAAAMTNNLTAASAQLVPEVLDALAWVGAQPGVLGAAMAGSGSATFALCQDAPTAAGIAREARGRGWWATATATRSTGVQVTDEDEGSA